MFPRLLIWRSRRIFSVSLRQTMQHNTQITSLFNLSSARLCEENPQSDLSAKILTYTDSFCYGVSRTSHIICSSKTCKIIFKFNYYFTPILTLRSNLAATVLFNLRGESLYHLSSFFQLGFFQS